LKQLCQLEWLVEPGRQVAQNVHHVLLDLEGRHICAFGTHCFDAQSGAQQLEGCQPLRHKVVALCQMTKTSRKADAGRW
jgi:hypothetical protein